jgi:acid phosphatase family membrane protein YuiD
MNAFNQLIHNTVFMSAATGWLVAQVLKTIIYGILNKTFNPERMVGSGGMPSSHSSFTMALSFSIAKYHGFDSPMFAIAMIFSFVTMYDAQGIRRAAGRHAEILNDLILDHKMPNVGELKELLGHTPLEVAAGALLGIVIGLWL